MRPKQAVREDADILVFVIWRPLSDLRLRFPHLIFVVAAWCGLREEC